MGGGHPMSIHQGITPTNTELLCFKDSHLSYDFFKNEKNQMFLFFHENNLPK